MTTNVMLDNEDLRWHLEHSVDWDRIVTLAEHGFTLPDGPEDVAEVKEFCLQVLEEVGRFVAQEIVPRAEALDRKGTSLVDGEVKVSEEMEAIFAGMADMGLMGLPVPRELDGLNSPLIVCFVLAELISRADPGVMTHFSFFYGISMALLAYGAKEGKVRYEDGQLKIERFEEAIRELTAGEAWGAMVLTEPDAGSDLGALRATAVQDEQGVWRLSGEKVFITSGHGQHHIVLARTAESKDAAQMGLDGLSLFLVPRIIERDGKRIDNIVVTKVEKKLGHASSPTCSLLYENSICELIGEVGQGFELMLLLMNNARVAVSFEAIGVCEAAYRMSWRYCHQRKSMGKLLVQHELLADMLEEMDTDIRGLRALAFDCANAVEVSCRAEFRLQMAPPTDAGERHRLERDVRRMKRRGRELTPLLKYIAAEKAVEITRRNMQLHGGMGYMTETGADRLLRDALVIPVYEGTSQIQALMALKDHLGFAIKDPVRFLKRAAKARLDARTQRGLAQRLAEAEVCLYQSMEVIIARVLGTKLKSEWSEVREEPSWSDRFTYLRSGFLREWDTRQDFAHGLVHAERLTEILVRVSTGRILLEQAAEHPEREIYARRYLKRMLPKVRMYAAEIREGTDLGDLRDFANVETSEGVTA